MCGYLHWCCDYNWAENDFAKNGKEWLLYPSAGDPVYSVRMEYFRDGAEDFELLRLADALPEPERTELAKRIAEISSDSSALAVDPERMSEVRRLVADTLSNRAGTAVRSDEMGAWKDVGVSSGFWDVSKRAASTYEHSAISFGAAGYDLRWYTQAFSEEFRFRGALPGALLFIR